MPFKFNPFSGNFDQTGSGGGASYIDGEEATYNDLSLDAGVAPLNSAWLVRNSSGIWPVSRKQAGIYIRTATAGSSRDADYTYAGTMPDVFSDAVFTLYDDASTTRTGQFNLGSITAGQNRVLTWPDGNGTIALTSDIPAAFDPASPGTIGATTPAAATFTNLTANTRVNLPNTNGTTAGDLYRNANTLRYRDSTNTERLLLSATENLSDLTNAATARANLGLGGWATLSNGAALGTQNLTISDGESPDFIQFTAGTGVFFYGNRAAQFRGALGLGTSNNVTFGSIQNTPIGSTTPAAGSFSTLNVTGTTELVNGGTTAGPFRLYNISSAANANFERLSLRWASNVAIIGTEKLGTGSARPLEFQTDGVTRMTILATGEINVGNLVDIGNGARIGTTGVQLDASASLRFSASNIGSSSDLFITRGGNGILTVAGSSGSFNRLQFGGTTNLFPALKRSSTTLQVRLADDTAYSVLDAQLRAQGTAPATSGATGTAGDIRYDADYIYVCTAANTWKRAAIATW